MAKEIGGRKYFWFAILVQNVGAYVVTLIIYQLVGLDVGQVAFSAWTVVAGVLLLGVLYLLFRRDPNKKKAPVLKASGI
jgi:ferrous iron transport protein B